jgi:hypothetical protein
MKPSDSPFKPGSPEHNDWVKNTLTIFQRVDGPTWNAAVKIADNRLAQLKARYPVGKILDADIDKLVNGFPEDDIKEPAGTPISSPFLRNVGRLGRINEHFAKMEQYVIVSPLTAYMPQIDSSPDWVTDKQLYSILFKASCRNVKEVKQQHGYLFYAVMKSLTAMQAVMTTQLSVDQVRVYYELWRR